MKKVLFLFFAMVAVTSGAQTFEDVEELIPVIQKEDPMLGTKADTVWISEHAEISPYYSGKRIIIKDPDHIFTKMAKVGYYSNDKTLLYMAPSVLLRTNQDCTRADFNVIFSKESIPYGEYSEDKYYEKKAWRVLAEDILKWMQNNDGYIRIICYTYGNNIYDLKIRVKK